MTVSSKSHWGTHWGTDWGADWGAQGVMLLGRPQVHLQIVDPNGRTPLAPIFCMVAELAADLRTKNERRHHKFLRFLRFARECSHLNLEPHTRENLRNLGNL